MKVDDDWWEQLCAYSLSRGEWPTETLRRAADEAMVTDGFALQPAEVVIIRPHRRHPAKSR